ncbi:MAG: SIMPL domain-containing protein [Gemmatimonadales bacterium]
MGISLVALATIPSLLSAQGAQLDQTANEPRIVATATRTTRVAPDRAVLYVVIEGSAETPAEAVQRAQAKVQAVNDAIRGAGVAQGMSTVPLGVSPLPTSNPFGATGQQPPNVARYVVRVAWVDVAQVGTLSAAVIAAGAASGGASTFEASAADSIRHALYGEALGQAQRDAQALAASLGGRLGLVVEATSGAGPTSTSGPNFVNFGSPYQSVSTPLPDVMISATATVRFRFVPR